MADRSESSATNDMVHDAMRTIADRMDLDELPLGNPSINFYRVARSKLQQMGFRGQDLDHSAYKLVEDLVYTITGQEGPLFRFPALFEKRSGDLTFDHFFLMNVKQKASTMRARQKSKQNLLPRGPSITPGVSEDRGDLSEDALPGGESAFDEAARADDLAKKARVFSGIPSMLSDKLGGESLVLIWDLLRSDDGYTLQEIAEKLTEMGVPTIEGGPWNTGVVSRAKIKIINFVRQYLQLKGINWSTIESSRVRSRTARG